MLVIDHCLTIREVLCNFFGGLFGSTVNLQAEDLVAIRCCCCCFGRGFEECPGKGTRQSEVDFDLSLSRLDWECHCIECEFSCAEWNAASFALRRIALTREEMECAIHLHIKICSSNIFNEVSCANHCCRLS